MNFIFDFFIDVSKELKKMNKTLHKNKNNDI